MKTLKIALALIFTIGTLLILWMPNYIINKRVGKSKMEFDSIIDKYFHNTDNIINSKFYYPAGAFYDKKNVLKYYEEDNLSINSLIENDNYKRYFIPENQVYLIEHLSRKDSFFNYTTYQSSLIGISVDEYVNKQIGSYNINGSKYVPLYQKQRTYNIEDVESYYHRASEYLINEIKENFPNYHINPNQLSLNNENLKEKLDKIENEYYKIDFGYPLEDSARWVIGKFTTTKISSRPFSLSIGNVYFNSFYTKSEEPLKIQFKLDHYNSVLNTLKDKFNLFLYIFVSANFLIWILIYFRSKKNFLYNAI